MVLPPRLVSGRHPQSVHGVCSAPAQVAETSGQAQRPVVGVHGEAAKVVEGHLARLARRRRHTVQHATVVA